LSTGETIDVELPVADDGPARLSSRARTILIRLTALVFLVVVLVVVLARGGPPEAAAVRAPVDAPAPDTAAIATTLSQQPQGSGSASSRASRGSGRQRSPGRAAAEWRYVPAGDITDLFCRPHGDEAYEDWEARVPDYCIERAE
jgi:hypothetical protein